MHAWKRVAGPIALWFAWGCMGGDETSRMPRAAPSAVQASTTIPEHVRIEWKIGPGLKPKGFQVIRDGVELTELPPGARSYEDAEAEPGRATPPKLQATSRDDAVVLSWWEASFHAGPEHEYQVKALYGSGKSEISEAVRGSRSAPTLTGYRLSRDGEEIAQHPPHARDP